ncbi:MAG: polysaccharide biosynthesis tyrosine autokinase, partial [Bacteroidota bacterium]
MFNPQVDSSNNNLKDITEKLNQGLDVGVLAFLFNKSKYWIVSFFLVSSVCAFIYLRYSQSIFESTAVLQINDGNQASDILKINTGGENENILAEAIEQIRSKVFLKRVVERMDISVNYFSEGTFKNNELYHSSPYLVKINVKNPAVYGEKLYIELNNNLTGGTLKSGKSSFKFVINEWLFTDGFDVNVYLNNKVPMAQVNAMVKENKGLYFTSEDKDAVTAALKNKLTVRTLSDLAKTISLKITDVNKNKSTDIVNAITEEYLVYDVERKSESSTNILAFIDFQLESISNALKTNESDLQRFKKEKNYSDKDKLMSTEMARYSTVEDQMLQVQTDEKILTEIQNSISRNKGINNYQIVSLLSGSEYESSIKEITQAISKLIAEKENLLYQLKPDAENIKQINFQLENQKKLLLESLEAVRLKYKTKYKSLLEKSSDFRSKMSQNPDDEVEFSRLNRMYTISEKYYTMLLEKKTEFQISKAGYVSKNLPLEKSNGPGALVSPSRKSAVIIAFVVSLVLSLLLVFVRYLFHDKIYTIGDITKYSSGNVALLGVVPKYPNDIPVSQLIVDKNPKALISEAFRSIRTNLSFIDNSPGTKIVAITSTISGEGKTFVAINIAGVLAFTGKKVVIIDLDMRKPKIHRGFGVTNAIGMSTILTGLNEVKDCFMNSPLENLKFITAGPSPPNPSELILSEKLDMVLEELALSFDYIVIDNAPIGLVTDGIASIQKAHYPIYVFRAGYSRKQFTQILDRLKMESNVKNLSVVLNDVDVSRKIYS